MMVGATMRARNHLQQRISLEIDSRPVSAGQSGASDSRSAALSTKQGWIAKVNRQLVNVITVRGERRPRRYRRRMLRPQPPAVVSWRLAAALLGLWGLVELPLPCWSFVVRPPPLDAGTTRRSTRKVPQDLGIRSYELNHPRRRISALGGRRDRDESSPLGDDDGEEEPRASDSSSSNSDGVPPVTAEMFWRDMLQDPPIVKRQAGNGKKAKKEYRVLDNRDSLPFSVQLSTPDPYSRPDPSKRKGSARPKRRGGSGSSSATEGKISSQLFMEGGVASGSANKGNRNNDDSSDTGPSPNTLLGEYQLDKHTTTGDVLLIGENQYKVVSHRCLYKYAGGQRFVMVKKILHVKEVGRWQAEEYLQRQWKNSPPSVGSANDPPLEMF